MCSCHIKPQVKADELQTVLIDKKGFQIDLNTFS